MQNTQTTFYRSAKYRLKALRDIDPKRFPIKNDWSQEHNNPEEDLIKRGNSLHNGMRITRLEQNQTLRTSFQHKHICRTQTYNQMAHQLMSMRRTIKEMNGEMWKDYSRVQLPSLEMTLPQSQFTILDPFRVQADFIQKLIDETAEAVNSVKKDIDQLREQIKPILPRLLPQLQQARTTTLSRLQAFRHSLSKDQSRHNECQLKYKQQIKDLEGELDIYKQSFDKTLNDIQDLQSVVFSTLPFELIESNSFAQLPPFQQKLF